jgi:hypothetical protein
MNDVNIFCKIADILHFIRKKEIVLGANLKCFYKLQDTILLTVAISNLLKNLCNNRSV